MRIVYFDCFSGISGDMTLGAFLDAGLAFSVLTKGLAGLKLKGYELKKSRVKRGLLAGTRFECVRAGGNSHSHRSLKEILGIIDKSPLGGRVKEISNNIFTKIGEAEAKVHGLGLSGDIRLHELGDIDSIIDIVGTAIAIDSLGIEGIYASRVSLGRSSVETRHGTLPAPAPATLELLKGVPVSDSTRESELVTPTGAGILKALSRSYGRMPRMKIERIGYGAGSRDSSEGMPNMLSVVIGESADSFKEDNIYVIETDIDDMNPQNFEYLFERLFKEGALDAYTTAIQMKKSRPAFKLTVLTEYPALERVSSVIFSETTTIGVRFYEAGRFKLERKFIKVKTAYGGIKVKVSAGPGGIKTVTPEYEECAALARKNNIPLKIIFEEAKNAIKLS